LKTDLNAVMLILTLLIFGYPLPAIVIAFKIDECTLADWWGGLRKLSPCAK